MYKCLRPFTEHFYNNFLMCSSVTFFFLTVSLITQHQQVSSPCIIHSVQQFVWSHSAPNTIVLL